MSDTGASNGCGEEEESAAMIVDSSSQDDVSDPGQSSWLQFNVRLGNAAANKSNDDNADYYYLGEMHS